MTEANVTNLSREQMEKLLDEKCPGMSVPTRSAVLQGSLLTLQGKKYRIPDAVRDGKPTHSLGTRLEKVGDEWNH